mmetsp:Transcript_345/g.471  ORF Transcript_345/g.471 Transcript_345/m.471 type:complete len:266 (-) Transcript_345:149-946(-)
MVAPSRRSGAIAIASASWCTNSTRPASSRTSGSVRVCTSCLCNTALHNGQGMCSVSELSTRLDAKSAQRLRRNTSKQLGQKTCAQTSAKIASPPPTAFWQTIHANLRGSVPLAPETTWTVLNFPTGKPPDLKISKDSHRGSTIAGTNWREVQPPTGRCGFGLGKAALLFTFPCVTASIRTFRIRPPSFRRTPSWANLRIQAFASVLFNATRASKPLDDELTVAALYAASSACERATFLLDQSLGHRTSKHKQRQPRLAVPLLLLA